MFLNESYKDSNLKCVIKAYKSFKLPVNTVLSLEGKYQKSKLFKKSWLKNFHFRLILTLRQGKKIVIYSTFLA